MKILILANHVNSVVLFRMELLNYLKELGNEIILSLPISTGDIQPVQNLGIRIIDTRIEQRGMNPISDLKLFKEYIRIIKKEKPQKIIAYTVKCNIYGGMASNLFKIPFYANITGLGYSFQTNNKLKHLITILYRIGLKKAICIFCENSGIKNILTDIDIADSSKITVLAGAGVNTQRFRYFEYPEESEYINFLFVGRIMQEKGIDELLSAIYDLYKSGYKVHFDFVGPCDDKYSSEIENLVKVGIVTYHGYQDDVRPFLKSTHCLVLPSWHEGMSNALLEAAASGRPLITSDIDGCRQTVIENVSGLLHKAKDAESLLAALKSFISFPYMKRKIMGIKGRQYMIESFEKTMVVKTTVEKLELTDDSI